MKKPVPVVDDEELEGEPPTPPKKKKAGASVKPTPPAWQKIADEMTAGPVKGMPPAPPKKAPVKPVPQWKKIAAAMAATGR